MSKSMTKKVIAYSFKELLKEKPLNKITVNDIAAKCDINRQTFYYHFIDIRDLIEWICLQDADAVLKENKTYDTWTEGFLSIFELMLKDKVFIINIYKNAPRDILLEYLHKMTYNLLYNVVDEKSKAYVVTEDNKAYIANFYKFGYVGIVLEWIADDMRKDPRDIVSHLSSLLRGSLDNALKNADRQL